MPGAPPEFSECSGARKRQQELLVLNQRKKAPIKNDHCMVCVCVDKY